ncbi:hypothetical protein B0H12DRAFT_1151639, partial [Mycena haematopus]
PTMCTLAPSHASLRPRLSRHPFRSFRSTTPKEIHELVLQYCRYSTMPWHMFTSRGNPPAVVSTLNPRLLSPNDYLDFSLMSSVIICFPRSQKRTYAQFHYCNTHHRFTAPFPPRCAGFLYYHTPANPLPLEGSIRLRVTLNNAPSSFDSGQDLLLPSGAPWQTILPQIARRKQDATLSRQLIQEKLVTEEQLSRARRLFNGVDRISPQLILFRMGQEFPVDFGSSLQLTVVGKRLLHKLLLPDLFSVGEQMFPWTGSGLACFEPSTSTGRRLVHLRLVQIVHPVSPTIRGYNGPLAKPEAGQLLSRDGVAPWACDIDTVSATAEALKALWNNSQIASAKKRPGKVATIATPP